MEYALGMESAIRRRALGLVWTPRSLLFRRSVAERPFASPNIILFLGDTDISIVMRAFAEYYYRPD
jgi:hypothetical protein